MKPVIDNVILGSFATAPPTFETIMEDLDVCAGETPRFAVVVEGKPIPDILWFKVVFHLPLKHSQNTKVA